MALSTIAASSTVRVIGPAVSWEWLIGTIWVRETRPTVGLKPTTPFTDAGQVMEPSVSVPMAAGARPMATATALPEDDPQAARKRWIAAMKPKGEITVDAGAAEALGRGKSLLPAGVTAISGRFGRGDPVVIQDGQGARLASGLVRYSSTEARAIAGHRSDEIGTILGYPGRAALIHRDDMVV